MSTIEIDDILAIVRERLFRIDRAERIQFPLGLILQSAVGLLVGRIDLRQGRPRLTIKTETGSGAMVAPVDVVFVERNGRSHRFTFDAPEALH